MKGPLVLSTSCAVGPVLAGGGVTESNRSPCAPRSLRPVEETDSDAGTALQERKHCYHRKGFMRVVGGRITSSNRGGAEDAERLLQGRVLAPSRAQGLETRE